MSTSSDNSQGVEIHRLSSAFGVPSIPPISVSLITHKAVTPFAGCGGVKRAGDVHRRDVDPRPLAAISPGHTNDPTSIMRQPYS